MEVGPAGVAATWDGSASRAAAAVLVGGGAYGVAQLDPGDPGTVTVPPATSESEPPEPAAVPPSFQHRDRGAIEPGTYRMFVGADPAGVKIEADLTVTGPNWIAGDQPVVSEGDTWAGVGVYQPDALAGVAPCSGDWQSRDAGGTPQALARQLVRLPRSTVVQPLTPTEAFGHDAIHLRLRIDDQCPRGRVLPDCRRGQQGVAASPTATPPRRSSSTSGSWT